MMDGKGLNGNILKIIAAAAMLIDHIGMILFPQVQILRLIGRIAFPIFSFFVAEGCYYTHNKRKYLGMILILGLIFQGVFVFATGQTMLNVFISFSISIALIYLWQKLKEEMQEGTRDRQVLFCILFFASLFLVYLITSKVSIDYGFSGIMIPVLMSLFDGLWKKKLAFIFGVFLLVFSIHTYTQAFCLLTIPILCLYNGKRGKYKMKYFFYVFYPLHLSILFLLNFVI